MTMTIVTSRTVGETAAAFPGTVEVFQRHGIDFCCGGGRALAEVCAERGIGLDELVRELDEAAVAPAPVGPDWNGARLAELSRHIQARYHETLRAELPRLDALMDKVLRVHGARHPELATLAREYARLHDELLPHMVKEERVLFPYVAHLEQLEDAGAKLAGSPFGSVQNPISVMLQEHEAAGTILAELRRLSRGFTTPADACNSFRGLYHGLAELERELHEHIHLENNVLFPRAVILEDKLRGSGGRARGSGPRER